MATGIKRSLPDVTVFTYQGDGDLASIGMGEIIASVGVPTLFVMEGGYMVDEIGINAVNVLRGYESKHA